MLEKAKKLAKYTESLAVTEHWGVDDQDTLEWLITEVEELMNTIENIQGSECPQCHRVKSIGSSECLYCEWDVGR